MTIPTSDDAAAFTARALLRKLDDHGGAEQAEYERLRQFLEPRRKDRLACALFYIFVTVVLVTLAVVLAAGADSRSGAPALVNNLPANANDFVRDVLSHEVEAQEQDHSLWSYTAEKREDGMMKVYRVYQTRHGQIKRLASADGRWLSPAEAEKEDQRIQKLITDPAAIRQQQKKERSDGQQARSLLQMFPDAFRYQYDGQQGPLVRLKFMPNSEFHPPSHAAQVFHHMEGNMLLDPAQKRLVSIDGKLTSEVKFFGGVFGHLDKGGTFVVRQEEVGPSIWEVSSMHVHMSGKALFFKSIGVREDETDSQFKAVNGNPTLVEAAEALKENVRDTPQALAKN